MSLVVLGHMDNECRTIVEVVETIYGFYHHSEKYRFSIVLMVII